MPHQHRHTEPGATCIQCGTWPAWAREIYFRLEELEVLVTDLSQAEGDLAAAVQQAVSTISGLESQVADLQQKLAAGDTAAAQAAANAIESQVATLKAAFPADTTTAPAATATPTDQAAPTT